MDNTLNSEILVSSVGARSAVVKIAVSLTVLSLVFGQLVRVPVLGQSGGLLISDIAVTLLIIIALYSGNLTYSKARNVLLWTLPFILWSLFMLGIHASRLPTGALIVATLYWIRLSIYLCLPAALMGLFLKKQMQEFTEKIVLIVSLLLICVGFLQMLFAPKLAALSTVIGSGWDPHEFRLVSTWLDPNFFGLFLVIVLTYVVMATDWNSTKRFMRSIIVVSGLIALMLTQSRSSFLALGAAAIVGLPFVVMMNKRIIAKYPMRYIAYCCIATALFFAALIPFRERIIGLVTVDVTAQIRLDQLQAVWQNLASQTVLFGVGYNAYQFALEEAGIASDSSLHSRAGADNSILTLWVTTGILGVTLFFLPFVYVAQNGFHLFIRTKEFWYLVPLLSLVAIVVHSQFVNSLLYAHILITLSFVWALSLSTDTQ